MKNTPENDEASSDHESGIASSTVPPSPIHYFPPAVRQAAFNSRSSSHSSMGSFNRGHLSEADHQPSRPSTPMSFAPPESIAVSIYLNKCCFQFPFQIANIRLEYCNYLYSIVRVVLNMELLSRNSRFFKM